MQNVTISFENCVFWQFHSFWQAGMLFFLKAMFKLVGYFLVFFSDYFAILMEIFTLLPGKINFATNCVCVKLFYFSMSVDTPEPCL